MSTGFSPAFFLKKCCQLTVSQTRQPHSHRFRQLSTFSAADTTSPPSKQRKELESVSRTFICVDCKESVNILSPFSSDPDANPYCLNAEPHSSHHFHLQQQDTQLVLDTPSITATCCFCSVSITVLVNAPLIPDHVRFKLQEATKLEPLSPSESALGWTQDDIWKARYVTAIDLALFYLEGVLLSGSTREINCLNPSFNSKLGRHTGSSEYMRAIGFTERSGKFYPPPANQQEQFFRALLEIYLDINTLVCANPSLKEMASQSAFKELRVDFLDAKKALEFNFGCQSEKSEFFATNAGDFFDKLGCVSDMSDEAILWNYRKCMSETVDDQSNLTEALLFIGSERTSTLLMEEAHLQSQMISRVEPPKHVVKNMTLAESYAKLGASPDVDDFSLRVAHEFMCTDMPTAKAEYDLALKTICLERKNDSLAAYCVESGIIETSVYQAMKSLNPSWPIGIKNIGNSCYLNSLLQYYFSLKVLRDSVLQFEATNPVTKVEDETAAGKTEQAHKFLSLLKSLFTDLIFSDGSFASPDEELVKIAFSGSNLGEQQDISECMDHVTSLLSLGMHGSPKKMFVAKTDMMQKLFYGTTEQRLTHPDATTKKPVSTTKEEQFSNLIIDAAFSDTFELHSSRSSVGDEDEALKYARAPSLHDCLESYFSAGTVELDQAQTERSISITTLPPILTILIQRAQYDRTTGEVYKSNNYIKFEKHLTMDRYRKEFRARAQTLRPLYQRLQRELRLIDKQLHYAMNPSPVSSKLPSPTYTEQRSIDELTSGIAAGISDPSKTLDGPTQLALDDLKRKQEDCLFKLAHMYDDAMPKKDLYVLHAAFIHQGEVSFGHYWVFLLDHTTQQWYKFNDATVEPVATEDEIFRDMSEDRANAYCLVYVKESMAKDLLETVCRSKERRAEYLKHIPK